MDIQEGVAGVSGAAMGGRTKQGHSRQYTAFVFLPQTPIAH